MVHPLWVPQRRRRPQGVRLNFGNKSLCLVCLFFLLYACFALEHISRVWCRSTPWWGFCKIWVDKQACLISVHNLFSQIYIWASLISVEFDFPWQVGISGHFPGFSGFPGVFGKISGNSELEFNSCEKVVIFQDRLFTPPLVDILILSIGIKA
jgi:hypothetical protein